MWSRRHSVFVPSWRLSCNLDRWVALQRQPVSPPNVFKRSMTLAVYFSGAWVRDAHTTTTIMVCNNYKPAKADDKEAIASMYIHEDVVPYQRTAFGLKRGQSTALSQNTLKISQTIEIRLSLRRLHQGLCRSQRWTLTSPNCHYTKTLEVGPSPYAKLSISLLCYTHVCTSGRAPLRYQLQFL